jgi:hypothetical protein
MVALVGNHVLHDARVIGNQFVVIDEQGGRPVRSAAASHKRMIPKFHEGVLPSNLIAVSGDLETIAQLECRIGIYWYLKGNSRR